MDSEQDDDVDLLWAEEVQRRYAEYQAERVAALPGDEVMRRAREALLATDRPQRAQ